jgi:hypothetical protein
VLVAEPTKAPGLSEDWKLEKKYWYIPEGDAGLSADEFQEKILTLKEGLGINTETAPIAHPGGLLPPEAPDTTVRPPEPLTPITPAPPSPPVLPKAEVIHNEATTMAEDVTRLMMSRRELEAYNAATSDVEKRGLLVDAIRKYWPSRIAVHYKGDKRIGFSDLDGEGAIFLFAEAGMKVTPKYVPAGYTEYGRINIDTGGMDGYQSLAGQKFEGLTDEELEKLQYEKTGFIDHHGSLSGSETSSTKYVYEFLKSLEMIKSTPGLDRFVDFITHMDNMTLPGLEESFENSHRTLAGLRNYIRRDRLPDVLKFFAAGGEPNRELNDDELKSLGLFVDVRLGREGSAGVVKNIPEERKQNIDKSIDAINQLESDQWGCAIDSPDFGKVLVDIYGLVPLGFEAAKAKGFDTYLRWSPEMQSFMLSTKKPISDSFNLPGGLKVRGRMILKPRGDRNPLKSALGLALRNIVGDDSFRDIKKDSELGKYIFREALSESAHGTEEYGRSREKVQERLSENYDFKGWTKDTYSDFRTAATIHEDIRKSGNIPKKIIVVDTRNFSAWILQRVVVDSEKIGFDRRPEARLSFVRYDLDEKQVLDPTVPENYKKVSKEALHKEAFLEWYLEKGSAGVVETAAKAPTEPLGEPDTTPVVAPAPEPPTETKNENFIDQINLDKVKEVLSSGAVWDYLDSDTSLEIDSDVLPADLITAMEDSRSRGEAPKLIFTIESIESYLMADSDLIKVVPIVTTKDGLSINGEVLNINIFRFFVIAKPADFPVWQWQREDLRRKFKDLVDTYSNIERGKSRKGVSEPTSEKTPDDGVVVPAPEPVVTDEVAEEEDATASLPDLSAEFKDEDELPAEEISHEMTNEEILAKYKEGVQLKPNSSEFVRIWRNNKKSQNIILSPSATYTVSNVYYQDVAGSDHKILLIQVDVKTNKKGEQDYYFVANASELAKAAEVIEPSQEAGDASVEVPAVLPTDTPEIESMPVDGECRLEFSDERVVEGVLSEEDVVAVKVFVESQKAWKKIDKNDEYSAIIGGNKYRIVIQQFVEFFGPDDQAISDLANYTPTQEDQMELRLYIEDMDGNEIGEKLIKSKISRWLSILDYVEKI